MSRRLSLGSARMSGRIFKFTGGLPVAVPGEVRGYAKIHELFGGGVSWESLFKPTIDMCENGMVISRHLGVSLRARENSFIQFDPLFR